MTMRSGSSDETSTLLYSPGSARRYANWIDRQFVHPPKSHRLLPQYRGLGVGHRFFDAREAHARALGEFRWTGFCAVERAPGDPRRPPFHRGNEAFWNKRGYTHRPELVARLAWNEVGRGEREHALSFWLRPLERAR